MKLFLYILFVITFIIKCNAYCNMVECNNYCFNVRPNKPHPRFNEKRYTFYGVCEPISEAPIKRHCRCDFRIKD
jgi:hypothetical protein